MPFIQVRIAVAGALGVLLKGRKELSSTWLETAKPQDLLCTVSFCTLAIFRLVVREKMWSKKCRIHELACVWFGVFAR